MTILEEDKEKVESILSGFGFEFFDKVGEVNGYRNGNLTVAYCPNCSGGYVKVLSNGETISMMYRKENGGASNFYWRIKMRLAGLVNQKST